VSLEADPFKRRLFGVVVIISSAQVFLGLSKETFRLCRLRVDAAECWRNVEVRSTGTVLAREVLLIALTLKPTKQSIN